jgi:hypothetical protein
LACRRRRQTDHAAAVERDPFAQRLDPGHAHLVDDVVQFSSLDAGPGCVEIERHRLVLAARETRRAAFVDPAK